MTARYEDQPGLLPRRTPAEAAAAADLGRPSARRSGRNPRWPHVPVIEDPDGHARQLLGLAFQTRTEALWAANHHLETARADLERKLADPRYRALREAHGLPRDLS